MKTNKERLEFIKSLQNKPTWPVAINCGNGIVVGSEGFGYEWNGEKLVKFPHFGDVKTGWNVEIGANSCIDRATLEGEYTEIGEGTKIDNLVHIAHNCKVGKHNLICAGAILCGGVVTGDRVFIGVGAMIKQKVKIGNDATVGMGAVVLKDIPPGETWAGNPAKKLKA